MSPRRSPLVEVVVNGEHRSVVTTSAIGVGDVILQFEGVEAIHPSRHSIQVGWWTHLVVPEGTRRRSAAWRYLNHACTPNAVVRNRTLVALVDLPAGTEVTFDYNTTEWDLADPFPCGCGHADCVGTVRGYRWLDEDARAARRETLSAWLVEGEREAATG